MHLKFIISLLLLICFNSSLFSQNISDPSVINTFLDCKAWLCENYSEYLRNEIKMVKFVRDRFYCDIHMMVNEQNTGGSNSKIFINIIGQKKFEGMNDSFEIKIPLNATDDEIRSSMKDRIELSLVKYVLKTEKAKYLKIAFNAPSDSLKTGKGYDPYNYWIYSVGAGGNLSGNINYSSNNYYISLSCERTVEKSKFSLYLGYNRQKQKFIFFSLKDSMTVKEEIKVNNYNYYAFGDYAYSLGAHWSLGCEFEAQRENFSNLDLGSSVSTKVEYSLFPYKEFNTKRIVLSYGIGVLRNDYIDTTIYLKTKEILPFHEASIITSFTQPWGNINIGIDWENYLNDFSLNNLGIGGALEWRVFSGLRFGVYGNYSFVRNQVYLPKGNATRDDLLTRRRDIGTSYDFFGGAGFRYQFGSQNNDIVNPRFNGLNYSISI